MLRGASAAIAAEYPAVDVHGVVGDFEQHLGLLPADGRRLVAFLGCTIGNFDAGRAGRVPRRAARRAAATGDSLLLGTDLVKDADRLVAAYDDAAGVTAEFNRNVLAVINRELDADFDVDAFEPRRALGRRAGVDRDAAALRARPDRARRPRST